MDWILGNINVEVVQKVQRLRLEPWRCSMVKTVFHHRTSGGGGVGGWWRVG